MSVPSTSKRFGEWGIKLKRLKALKALLLALLIGALAAGAVFTGLSFFQEEIAHWAEMTFYSATERFTGPDGRLFEVTVFQWERLYGIISIALGTIAAFWIVTLLICRARAKKQAMRLAEKEILKLMNEGAGNMGNAFPLVSAKLLEIQNSFQHKQELLRSESARKDDLVAYLAHDLKTPLTSVIGYLELLEEAPDMPLKQRAKYTGIALQKACRLEGLISDFFEITRYNIHEILIEWEKIDLNYMLLQMKEEFYPVLEANGNDLILDIAGEITVTADREKLGRVLSNILKNAVSYSYPSTPITIAAKQEDVGTVITISNQGKTIPEQKLSHIFEKFFRLDSARSTNSGGSGLGLAIAREIILAHGGSITAESRDEVTTFTIHLPKH